VLDTQLEHVTPFERDPFPEKSANPSQETVKHEQLPLACKFVARLGRIAETLLGRVLE
jgi:hypothetical protein